jgi:hypothetical protein
MCVGSADFGSRTAGKTTLPANAIQSQGGYLIVILYDLRDIHTGVMFNIYWFCYLIISIISYCCNILL